MFGIAGARRARPWGLVQHCMRRGFQVYGSVGDCEGRGKERRTRLRSGVTIRKLEMF